MRRLLFNMLLLFCLTAEGQLRLVSYNVENLFDTRHDSLHRDEDFTPEGKYRWNNHRYNRKVEKLARVIANIGGWQPAAVVGLLEVENEHCLQSLLCRGGLRNMGYRYLHRESPDRRGIDCALLYDPQQLQLVDSAWLRIPTKEPTRDILYAAFGCGGEDTLHILLCHLPSQRGGAQQSEDRRAAAYHVAEQHTDSLLRANPAARIVVMGDMNSQPSDRIKGLHNLMIPIEKAGEGSYKWKGVWSCLDQVYVSPSLLTLTEAHIYDAEWLLEDDNAYGGKRPMRCYRGLRWQDGYSDHLPVYADYTPSRSNEAP